MVDTDSWAWHVTTPWPGFDPVTQNNLGAGGNAMSIDPATLTTITWRDADGDDRIADTDTDDGSPTSDDRVLISGISYSVREIAHYPGGMMVINDTPYPVDFGVWLLEDGTFLVRFRDDQIPSGVHHTNVQSLTLGTFDGIEYSHSFISTRAEPFLCFVAGTLIHTQTGTLKVEDLEPGDAVLTADHGFRPLRWSARRRVPGRGAAAPVRFRAGALGNSRDLWLSQQHRVLISDGRADMMFGLGEALVAAVHLVNDHTIMIEPCDHVDYVHLLFDQHELIFSEGILTESYHPGAYNLSLLEDATRAEVLALFPDLAADTSGYGQTARPCLRRWEARMLLRAVPPPDQLNAR